MIYPYLGSKLFLFLSLHVCRRSKGGSGGGGAKSHDGEKAWSSINHSILAALTLNFFSLKTTLRYKSGSPRPLLPHPLVQAEKEQARLQEVPR
jgi:hypothetical protein